MQIARNKASGKCFIFIKDLEDGKGLMVTPQGKVKALELHLFGQAEAVDLGSADKLLNESQIQKYQEYMEITLSGDQNNQ